METLLGLVLGGLWQLQPGQLRQQGQQFHVSDLTETKGLTGRWKSGATKGKPLNHEARRQRLRERKPSSSRWVGRGRKTVWESQEHLYFAF